MRDTVRTIYAEPQRRLRYQAGLELNIIDCIQTNLFVEIPVRCAEMQSQRQTNCAALTEVRCIFYAMQDHTPYKALNL